VKPIPIHAHNPGPITGDGNWTWLLPGRVPTLVDAGTGDHRHLAAVDAALGGSALAQVLVTHGHGDHASGAEALRARFPSARFLKMPWPERDANWSVPWEPLEDLAEIEAGDAVLRVIHTPGHAPDHVGFWHEASRVLLSGDLAMRGGTIWIPARLQGDLGAYLASLKRVIDLEPARLLPAHGSPIDDPLPLLRQYIAHRLEREAQIVEAVRAGYSTPGEIVGHVYVGLRPSAVELAQESVLAHLLKLERDGRAARVGDRWHIMEP
jgi:glyoxylase-like metal-dependent hydrolase (beta-lactamase superfamily II)